MNVSEIKQEILDLLILNGRKPQTIKTGERVVYLYDALNIVNKEFSKTEQPQLNSNQQKYLKQLQYNYERLGNTHDALFFGLVDYEKRWNFNDKNFAQVLQIFAEWTSEQEAE